jgi:hypothetical protein
VEEFEKIVKASANYNSLQWKTVIDELFNYTKQGLYAYEGLQARLGFSYDGGLTGYYSPNLSRDELDATDELLQIINISPLNTRVVKQ